MRDRIRVETRRLTVTSSSLRCYWPRWRGCGIAVESAQLVVEARSSHDPDRLATRRDATKREVVTREARITGQGKRRAARLCRIGESGGGSSISSIDKQQAMAAYSRPPDGPRQRRGLLSSHSLPPLFGLAARGRLSLSLSASPSARTRSHAEYARLDRRAPATLSPFHPSRPGRGARVGKERVRSRGWWGWKAGGEAPSGGGGTGCGGAVASERRSVVGTLDRAIPPSQESDQRRY